MEYIVIGLIVLFVVACFTPDSKTVSGPRDPLDNDRTEWTDKGRSQY